MLLLWPICTSPWGLRPPYVRFAVRARMGGVWIQKQIELRPRPRGFHLVTSEIVDEVPDLGRLSVGIATLFMQHTSASLTLNENASPDVRRDFAAWFDRAVPDGADYFAHTARGPRRHAGAHQGIADRLVPDDPGVRRLAGTGDVAGHLPREHRDNGGARRVVFTAFGEER